MAATIRNYVEFPQNNGSMIVRIAHRESPDDCLSETLWSGPLKDVPEKYLDKPCEVWWVIGAGMYSFEI